MQVLYFQLLIQKRWFAYGDSKRDLLPEAESLQPKAIVMQHLFQIQNGYSPVLDCHTSHFTCKFKEITSKIDR
ncbi:MAG: hypothetical protein EZS28_018299 [Streblomastix strix]|uniref:GTP-eEF1A C-terminal domain-containing protein n=1 Tax=Streblomastix strix TaxID=222440 RepID=A0A5J4VUW6_9EUKA|nr:MAG: hypothetical protein EZS28_018299 [Streblomastix strix]